ncbi:threonine-phosphate decarboxylase [Priestia megaterium]|nr:threonine-phosphate decarboxylase [Priestia megaterium]
MSLPTHGANPATFLQAIGKKNTKQMIDFSVNTNPLGAPKTLHEKWNDMKEFAFLYPDPEAASLTEKIADHHQVTSEEVLPTNGAAEAFFLVASLFSSQKVAILQPTFVEYEQASHAFGCKIVHIPLDADNGWNWDIKRLKDVLPTVSALWICHPNNPTGVTYQAEQWIELIEAAKKEKTYLIIDEAFIDFVDSHFSFDSFVRTYSHLIVVRSMTKMFNIAGIRLGYVLANSSLIKQLKISQPPWSVNGIAQRAGTICLNETAFVKQTVSYIKKERERVLQQLSDWGFSVSPSVTNYYICSVPKEWESREWLMYLAENGIVARHTENFLFLKGKYLRFAVKTKQENDVLLAVIRKGLDERC